VEGSGRLSRGITKGEAGIRGEDVFVQRRNNEDARHGGADACSTEREERRRMKDGNGCGSLSQ